MGPGPEQFTPNNMPERRGESLRYDARVSFPGPRPAPREATPVFQVNEPLPADAVPAPGIGEAAKAAAGYADSAPASPGAGASRGEPALQRPSPAVMAGLRTSGGLVAVRESLPDSYTEAVALWSKYLNPGEEVPENVPLGFLRSAPVHPGTFTLREDRDGPTKDVPFPGKSATVVFTLDAEEAVPVVLRRPATPRDRVFTTTADRLREAAGFVPFHAPTRGRPLHVQVVHENHLTDPTRPDVPESARRSLARLLQREASRKVL